MRSSWVVTLRLDASRVSDQRLDPGAIEIIDIVAILQEAAERLRDGGGVEMRAVQPHERLRPVDRFRDAGRLRKAAAAERLHEARDLARQLLGRARRLETKNLYFLLERRVIHEQIQAAAAQRVADLAAAVRRENHVWYMLRADRPELRNRHLEVR